MDLQPYVDVVRHELTLAAAAAGPDAQQLAERLSAPLDSALRLALLEALSSATEEISGELGSGSVEVRLRGRDPEFVVDVPDDSAEPAEPLVYDEDGGATWRITLRLPEGCARPWRRRPGATAPRSTAGWCESPPKQARDQITTRARTLTG